MKKLIAVLFVVATLGGCSYGGVAMSGDTAVVVRNDMFLFGALRKAYVCKVTPTGLAQCVVSESP